MSSRDKKLNDKAIRLGPVVYWMSRDQRVEDNWALLHAQEKAIEIKQPLVVVFCRVKKFLKASDIHYAFMMKGLNQVSDKLKKLNINFYIIEEEPKIGIPNFINIVRAGALFTDFNPLKISRAWKESIASNVEIPFIEVDAHNIVPCFEASNKQEFAAYTFRPKVNKKLEDYLIDFPKLKMHPFKLEAKIEKSYAFKEEELKLTRYESGEAEARSKLKFFLQNKLNNYEKRNDPNEEACSGLSPYLHFGHISAQRVALEAYKAGGAAGFLEELIVRRELADNFCYYNENYDNVKGFPEWARKTLEIHAGDIRENIYSLKELEDAKTHDRLWNAAQMEMVKDGKMHGYMRMYWAKKILEWSNSAEEAMEKAIYLNDSYQLDGRDPNGYAGIAWSIGGVHDRAWGERAIFGKIRYMSYDGCKRKFDIEKYIKRVDLA